MRIPRLVFIALITAFALTATSSAQGASRTLGHHASSVLVTFEDSAGATVREAAHAAVGATVAARWPELDTHVVSLPEGLDPVAAVAAYERLAGVADAALNKRVKMLTNDTLFRDQWGFHNTGQTATGSLIRGKADFDIDAPEGWDKAFGAGQIESTGGTLVAVLDTGVERGHVDLLNKVKHCATAVSGLGVVTSGSCSDDNFHGTHTAGTVAAATGNGLGVAGTAPNADLAIFKFLNGGGVGFVADEIAGIRWAHRTAGAKVISMSVGSYESDGTERQAVSDATNAGILVVAAAGNDYDETPNYPAYYPEVMSVASTSADDDISPFSNCNGDVEIAAPGEDIWSTFPGNGYGIISGTSMATPHVSGVAALVMSERGLTGAQTRTELKNTAVAVTGNDGRTLCSGLKQVNLASALGSTTAPPVSTEPGAIAGTVTEGGKTKAAIASATVDCGGGRTATTGSDGRYSIASVPAGTHTCTASKTGYTSKSQSVTVASGTTTTSDFALRAR